jgi:hypothetical protein
MGAIRLTSFGGIIPRASERLIPDNAAQVAVNCRLSSGELIPFNAGAKRYTSAKAGPLLAIHRVEDGGSDAWLAWPHDADVVKASLYGAARWCITGDGEPRITTLASAVSGSGNDYPHTAYTLGTPKPVTAPTVAPTGGVSATTVDRFYAHTFYAEWDGVEFEGAVSPVSALVSGKVDATWQITGMDTTPPNSGTVMGTFASSKTEFTDTVDTFLRVGEQVVIAGDTLTVTDITGSKTFKVAGDYHLATTWARKAAFPGTIYKRLYRSTGTTGQFQLVVEGLTGTTYNDTLTDSQILGDELITASWEMPPTGLTGLFALPSGSIGGFIGNKACFSEPDQPHAWPPEYQMQADYPIVGAECFGSGVALLTTSWPFIIQGIEPGQMSGQSWKEALPCQSKRGVCSLGDMVVFPSTSGIKAASGAGVVDWSLPYFTEKEFKTYMPETMVAAMVERRLYVLYSKDGSTRVLIFNLNGDDQYLTEAHFMADEIHGGMTDGHLYYSFGSDIYEFDPADGYTLSQDWMSKEIILPMPQNLGAAKINFKQAMDPAQIVAINAEIAAIQAANAVMLATGKVHGAWNTIGYNGQRWNGSDLMVPPAVPPANEVTFQLYVDGAVKSSRTVSDNKIFTLPSGYKADNVAVRVQSQCLIKSVEIGETPDSLRRA